MIFPRLTTRNLYLAFYGLLATVFFLYVLFPGAKFKEFCEVKISEVLADGECTIGEIGFRFPATVQFEDISISSGTGRDISVLNIESIAVSNNGILFWRDFAITGKVLSGTVSASLNLDWQEGRFRLPRIAGESLDLAALDQQEGLSQREMSGEVSFTGQYEADLSSLFSGVGEGKFKMVQGSMELVQPILSLEEIVFDRVESALKYEKGVVYFTAGEFNGKDLGGEFSGVAALDKPFVKTGLTLSGRLDPQPLFLREHPREERLIERLLKRYGTKKLPFQVGGTLQRPTFRFAT